MSGGGKSPSTKIYDYLMSMHYGICTGPLDSVNKIIIKERDAWVAGASDNTTILIDRNEFFGGDTKEGGVYGNVDIRLGDYSQLLTTEAAAKFGKTPTIMSGYRGIANLFFRAGTGAFKWCTNNPYLPGVWVNVTRLPAQLSFVHRRIDNPEYFKPDANPASMMYEIMTDEDWGMGEATSNIQTSTFTNAATTLFNEGFGLSMIWAQQGEINTLLQEIQDHIQATLFVRPSTGKWEMKLLRADYDINDSLEVNPSNADVTNRIRRLIGETTNEIVISYTNPIDEGDRTVSFQDLANISMQGGVVSDTRNYYGVRSTALANKLGVRDLRAAAYPLFSCEITGDRTFWDVVPGDVLRLNWPEDGIVNMPIRITKVDYGTTNSRVIKMVATEDIFGLESSEYSSLPTSEWTDPNPEPVGFDYVEFHTLPVPLMLRGGFSLRDIGDDDYPRVITGVMADSDVSTAQSIDLYGDVTNSTGLTDLGLLGVIYPTSSGLLQTALTPEVTSTWTVDEVARYSKGGAVAAGHFFQIGNGDVVSEIVMLYSLSGSDWTVARGVMDTIPETWPIDTRVWYIGQQSGEFDPTEAAALADTRYRLVPNTGRKKMPLGDAPDFHTTPTERPYQPHRPAKVRVGSFDFWDVAHYVGIGIPPAISVTWANRNRRTEDTVVLRWDAATTTPESGQTTTLELRDQITDSLINRVEGVTGTSHNFALSLFDAFRFYTLQVFSVRDGFESIRKVNMLLDIEQLGYGSNYGYDYGENDGS